VGATVHSLGPPDARSRGGDLGLVAPEGAGVTDVLFGDQPFTGTTPYTWPNAPEHAPRSGKAACDGAVFPHGYGLAASGALLGPACPAGS
jgi:hypothetical protein